MLLTMKGVSLTDERFAFVLSWQSVTGRTYSVWRTDDLRKGWGEKPMLEMDGTGERLECIVDLADANSGFFRVSVRLSDGYWSTNQKVEVQR